MTPGWVVRGWRGLHEPWWIEFWSGVTAVAWAKFIFWMGTDLTDQPRYSVLTSIADDARWEWMGFLLGLVQITVALIDCRWGRWTMSFLMAWWWLCLGYAIWLTNKSAPGVVVYFGWGLANMTSMALLFRPHAR